MVLGSIRVLRFDGPAEGPRRKEQVSDADASPMGVEDAARGKLDVELERERGAAATKTRSPLDSARIYTKPTEAGEEAGVSAQGGAADTPARLARPYMSDA